MDHILGLLVSQSFVDYHVFRSLWCYSVHECFRKAAKSVISLVALFVFQNQPKKTILEEEISKPISKMGTYV